MPRSPVVPSAPHARSSVMQPGAPRQEAGSSARGGRVDRGGDERSGGPSPSRRSSTGEEQATPAEGWVGAPRRRLGRGGADEPGPAWHSTAQSGWVPWEESGRETLHLRAGCRSGGATEPRRSVVGNHPFHHAASDSGGARAGCLVASIGERSDLGDPGTAVGKARDGQGASEHAQPSGTSHRRHASPSARTAAESRGSGERPAGTRHAARCAVEYAIRSSLHAPHS